MHVSFDETNPSKEDNIIIDDDDDIIDMSQQQKIANVQFKVQGVLSYPALFEPRANVDPKTKLPTGTLVASASWSTKIRAQTRKRRCSKKIHNRRH